MARVGSLLWILFLLAALFVGPAVILDLRSLDDSQEPQTLRQALASEQLRDAPAPLPSLPTGATPSAAR
ncbi:MAG TPA: hypothetical protein DD417_20070 [Elusimicrobia bacterium]|nr:hypothetical protein [Elusimicrobiota bacterium]